MEFILKKKHRPIHIGATVLHIASKCGQKKLIEWYFKYFDCRNATITTSNGATCLHFACVSGSYMCVKQIVEAAPEIINMKAKNGLTPIYLGKFFVKFLSTKIQRYLIFIAI